MITCFSHEKALTIILNTFSIAVSIPRPAISTCLFVIVILEGDPYCPRPQDLEIEFEVKVEGNLKGVGNIKITSRKSAFSSSRARVTSRAWTTRSMTSVTLTRLRVRATPMVLKGMGELKVECS